MDRFFWLGEYCTESGLQPVHCSSSQHEAESGLWDSIGYVGCKLGSAGDSVSESTVRDNLLTPQQAEARASESRGITVNYEPAELVL